MRAVDIIIKKRDQQELSTEEIEFFVRGYTLGEIADYQAAAWAMAVLLNGMTPRETRDLTLAMAHSGEILNLEGIVPVAVDKHSTGGVGDKTTLVVEPAVAACGLPVGKMSGRGLGFSGGTLDKMESIPGYRTNLTTEEFIHQLRTLGLVLTGQSADLAPADGKFYALRDVTGTVESIPLIASSIMSKKIAAGAQAIVLDVKVGSGAFMRDLPAAQELATLMVKIAHLAGRKAVALLSDMSQPLGCAVGNALEVKEAIQTLQGGGPEDFREHCLQLAGHMLALAGYAQDENEGKQKAASAIADGRAWERFIGLVKAQGGDVKVVENPALFPSAPIVEVVSAPQNGYLREVDALEVGRTAVLLGAGRSKKGDRIDHAVGIEVFGKVGDRFKLGQPLFSIHARDQAILEEARAKLISAHSWSEEKVAPLPLFYGLIKGETD
jgi:pyrimidine-nucleoside phosphorylase